jgi:hypothetical protein
MPDLPDIEDHDFFSWPGCVSLLGVFLAFIGIAAGVTFAIGGSTEGLLLAIVFLLAGILLVLATKHRRCGRGPVKKRRPGSLGDKGCLYGVF